MNHPDRVGDYLEQIVEAISRAESYLSDSRDFAAFQSDKRSQDAIIRNIEIIGEAAAKILKTAPAYAAAHPDIPWAQMRAIRNVVIHEYFSVDLATVWDTVRNDLPALKARTLLLLANTGPEQDAPKPP